MTIRVWSGACADANVKGAVDGYHSNPPRPRESFATPEEASAYRTGYLDYWPKREVALFRHDELTKTDVRTAPQD